MKQVIWNNDVFEAKAAIQENLEDYFPGKAAEEVDEDLILERAYEEVDMRLDDEKANLNSIPVNGAIIVIGKEVRWNGAHAVCKDVKRVDNLGDALQETIDLFGGDNSFSFYYEDGSVFLSQTGHDNPVNPTILEFRELQKGLSFGDLGEAYFEGAKEQSFMEYIMEYSDPLGHIAEKIYGFEQWDRDIEPAEDERDR